VRGYEFREACTAKLLVLAIQGFGNPIGVD
jgi:hypothetical protein